MTEIHYGVVKRGELWVIIGRNLEYGGYRHRSSAVRAARRLAVHCAGLPVALHLQEDSGKLLPPEQIDPLAEA